MSTQTDLDRETFVRQKYDNFLVFLSQIKWITLSGPQPNFDVFMLGCGLFMPVDLVESVCAYHSPLPREVIPSEIYPSAEQILAKLSAKGIQVNLSEVVWADVHKLCRYLDLFWKFYKNEPF